MKREGESGPDEGRALPFFLRGGDSEIVAIVAIVPIGAIGFNKYKKNRGI